MLYGPKCSCGYTDVKEFITLDDYFKCYSSDQSHPAYGQDFRKVEFYRDEFNATILNEATKLLKATNSLLGELLGSEAGRTEVALSSGWRPKRYAREIGLSPRSNHCFGRALDMIDLGNKFYHKIELNLELLVRRGMAMEHVSATPTWLHLQSVLPRSGNTIFYP